MQRQNLNVVRLKKKYTMKSECLIDHHLQGSIFKGLWFFLDLEQPPFYQLKNEPRS